MVYIIKYELIIKQYAICDQETETLMLPNDIERYFSTAKSTINYFEFSFKDVYYDEYYLNVTVKANKPIISNLSSTKPITMVDETGNYFKSSMNYIEDFIGFYLDEKSTLLRFEFNSIDIEPDKTYTITIPKDRLISKVDQDSLEEDFVFSFKLPSHSLEVISDHGTVIKSPDKTSYEHGEEVTLTAMPEAGYEFSNWSGDVNGSNASVTIIVNKNMNIVANYILVMREDVNKDGLINDKDVKLIVEHYGEHMGEISYDINIDVNLDGIIDIVDLSLVLYR